MQETPRYTFDDLELDVGRRRVSRGETVLKLAKLTFDLLLALVESAPNVVTYDELSEKVWSGRPVSADTVAQRVLMLRRDLSDNADDPRYVEAVRGIGYRLRPDVTPVERSAAVPSRRSGTGWAGAAGLAVLLMVAGVFVINQDSADDPDRLPNSIAVMPFENLSPDPENAYFAAAIHDALLYSLGRLSSLTVIARPSVLGYENSGLSLTEIAEQLNVETIMQGSVLYDDKRVRISAQLLDPYTGEQLWIGVYDRAFSDIFDIQSDVAFSIASELEAELTPADRAAMEDLPTDSIEAYELYLKAKLSASDDIDYWEATLNQAIDLDRNFALAYADIASNYARLLRGTRNDWEEKVERNTQAALRVDPDLTQAHMARAVMLDGTWRWNEADAAFRTAYESYPNDPEVLFHYGRFKREIGAYDEAATMFREYIKLNPRGEGSLQLGITYKYAGRPEEAASAFEDALDIDPTLMSLRIHVADVEIDRGNRQAALRHLQYAERLPPSAIAYRIGQMMLTYSRLGLTSDVERLFEELERVNLPKGEATWAMAYLASGDEGEAAERLRRAITRRLPIDTFGLIAFHANPWDLPILETPRFRALRDQISPADWTGP